jgi:Voltage gated calcium channel IQ domain
MIDLLVPRSEEINAGKLSVGKIYGGLLILESWRNTKFGQLETDAPVSNSIYVVCAISLPELTPKNKFYLVLFRYLFLFLSKKNRSHVNGG